MSSAVYAGSFDPPTEGHAWMIYAGARLFDKLYVAVGENAMKHPLFSVEERVQMLKGIISGLEIANWTEVVSFSNQYLVNYAHHLGANYIIRGIRDVNDFEYERGMLAFNRSINSNIETVYLQPPANLSHISSSTVKAMIGPNGWEEVVYRYVPNEVLTCLKTKFSKRPT